MNFLIIILIFTHCATDDSLNPDTGTDIINNDDTANILDNRGLSLSTTDPSANPTLNAKVELGRLLFYDSVLSGEQDVACATCHHPQFGYADGRELPIGVGGIGLGPNRFDATNDGRYWSWSSQFSYGYQYCI